jgi:hypothetical protein
MHSRGIIISIKDVPAIYGLNKTGFTKPSFRALPIV